MASKEKLLHLFFFVTFAAALYHNVANIFIDGVTNSYGGRFKFLTFINLLVSVFYYGLALGLDATEYGIRKSSPLLKKFRDNVFGSIIFPVSFIVTVAFWGVMAIDSELMLPTKLRHMIPVNGFYNHAAHSAPFLLSLVEIYQVEHPYFPSKTQGTFFYTLFCIAYLTWIMWIANVADIWVYPVLKVLTWFGRAIFLGSAYLFGFTMFLMGCKINFKQSLKHTAKLK